MLSIPEEIKNEFLSDNAVYNIRLHFPNGERTDITNEMIVGGTAKLTESLCSQNELKFGLCESPSFECETVGVENIRGASFDLIYEVICSPSVTGAVWKNDIQKHVYEMQMGKFICSSCDRQADLQHRRIVAYGGGAATNWKLPEWENSKMMNLKSTSTYTPDLAKFVFSKFNCEQYQTGKLVSNHLDQLKARLTYQKGDVTVSLGAQLEGVSTRNDVLFRNNFNYLLTPEEALKQCVDVIREVLGEPSQIEGVNNFINEVEQYLKSGWFQTNSTQPYYRVPLLSYLYGINLSDGLSIYKAPTLIEIYAAKGSSTKRQRINLTDGYMYQTEAFNTYTLPVSIPYKVTVNNVVDYLNMDLQKEFSNDVELLGKMAKVERDNSLVFIDLKKQFNLLPSDSLIPAANLKPQGVTGGSIDKNMYSALWYDEYYTKPYGTVHCNFKNTNNNDVDLLVYCQGYDAETDPTTYRVYDISNNETVRANTYSSSKMTTILQNIANAIYGVTFVPIDLDCISLPFIECGDTLEVLAQNNDSITSIMLKRTLAGECYITDKITSK